MKMINVRGIANNAIQSVNPDISSAVYRASTGWTTDEAGKRTPGYAPAVPVRIQSQAASNEQLKHAEKLNIQGVLRNVRMWGDTQGVVRPQARGGDLLQFPLTPGAPDSVWLVVQVLETWAEWCSVLVCLQPDAPEAP